MLVRANYILPPPLSSLKQPINWLETPSRLFISEHQQSGNTHQQHHDAGREQQIVATPDKLSSAARSANNKNCEYGSVAIENISHVSQQSEQEEEPEVSHGNNNNLVSATILLLEEEEEEDEADDNSAIVKSDVLLNNAAAVPHDMKLLQNAYTQQQKDNSTSVKDIYHNSPSADAATTTVLLNQSISTYYNKGNDADSLPATIKTEDNVIYYKRREDFYPQILKHQQQQKMQQLLDQQETSPASFASSIQQQQQNKRSSSIHNVLGKAATRAYPGNSVHSASVNENGSGMPVFIAASVATNIVGDKIKSKTVFKRLKTLVVKNKRRISTLA